MPLPFETGPPVQCGAMRRLGRRDSAKTAVIANTVITRERLDAVASSGLHLPNYADFTVLARGGSSVVFLAREVRIDRPVAVKVLPPANDAAATKQFEQEKEIAALLGRHPFIVQVFDAGSAPDGSPFLVMEYFERGSLAQRLRKEGPLPVAEAFDIVGKIASALQAAHDVGVLHRDVKPSNILFSQYGPALSDFGISRSMSRGEWTQSLAHFTPWHSAPEILEGENPSIASDVYSLASTLFTILDGRPPFVVPGDERTLAYQLRVLRDPLPTLLRRDVPPQLQKLLVTAMAKRPEDRFATVSEFALALAAVATSSPLPSATTTSATETAPTTPTTATSTISASQTGATPVPPMAPERLVAGSILTPTSSVSAVTAPAPAAARVSSDVGDDDAMFRPPSSRRAASSAPSGPLTPSGPLEPSALISPSALSATPVPAPQSTPAAPPQSTPITPPQSTALTPPVPQNGARPIASAPNRSYPLANAPTKTSAASTAMPMQSPILSTTGNASPNDTSGAVRSVAPSTQRSAMAEELTVVTRPKPQTPSVTLVDRNKLLVPALTLSVIGIISGLAIAFWPSTKANEGSNKGAKTSVGDSVPTIEGGVGKVGPQSPQNLKVTEKTAEDGVSTIAELSWDDGTPAIPVVLVAAYREGSQPKSIAVNPKNRRAVIPNIDRTKPYCYWALAFDKTATPPTTYRSEQTCVRGAKPFSF